MCAVATVVTFEIYNTYGVLGFLVGAKLLSYLYAVFPSSDRTLRRLKIRTHKQEKLAAIKLQRRWRDARARRRGELRGMNDANKKLVVFGRLQAKMLASCASEARRPIGARAASAA